MTHSSIRQRHVPVLLLVLSLAATIPYTVPALADSATESAPAVESVRSLMEAAVALDMAGQVGEAHAKVSQALRTTEFQSLGAVEQHSLVALAGMFAFRAGDSKSAHEHFMRASAFEATHVEDWLGRLASAGMLNDKVDVGNCLLVIARRWPTSLAQLDDRSIEYSAQQLDDTAPEHLQRQLLQALLDVGWKSKLGVEPDELWRLLARLSLQAGQLDKAAEVLKRIHSAETLIRIRIDRRFETFWATLPNPADVDGIQRNTLQRTETAMVERPRSLDAVAAHCYALRMLGQWQAMLNTTDTALQRIRKEGSSAYDDVEKNLAWIMNHRANALEALGHVNEAATQLQEARRLPENGVSNVSQTINLGALYLRLHRPAAAITVTENMDRQVLTDNGLMRLEAVRQHALDLLGRKKEAAVALAFLKTHRDADRDGYLDALVRKGAVAPAAAELIKMLETPSDRDAALWSVQTFRSSEKGPHNKDFARTRETMLSRGDVRAAIEKVGQRFDWPLYN